MDWTAPVDAYCERLAPGFWAEPLNAVSNLAFLLAAAVMWHRTRGRALPLAPALAAILAAIGVGSFLFHTVATAWAALADVVPIGVFILVYLYAANLHVLGLSARTALLGTLAFLPYASILTPLFSTLPFLSISSFYWTVPLLIFAYAALLARRHPATAARMALGGALLTLSITARSLDMILCPAWPLGTHFLWHLLNAVMLGWMIELYARHLLAARSVRG